MAVRMAAPGWHLSAHTVVVPPFLPIPPHPQYFLLTALLSSKTPESLINYKHAFSSICRRQISVLAAVSIPLVPLIDLAV